MEESVEVDWCERWKRRSQFRIGRGSEGKRKDLTESSPWYARVADSCSSLEKEEGFSILEMITPKSEVPARARSPDDLEKKERRVASVGLLYYQQAQVELLPRVPTTGE